VKRQFSELEDGAKKKRTLFLGRHAQRLADLLGLPVAKGFGLEIVDLYNIVMK
jgi:hypothetical protein